MRFISTIKIVLLFLIILLLINTSNSIAQAQYGPSLSFSYDILPYQDFDDPIIIDDVTISDAQAKLSKIKANFVYPVVFSKGRTILINEFSYQLIEFEFSKLTNPLKRLHSGSYSLMLQHRLSDKWSVWALGTPSLASDLGAEVSENDFNFQAATIFIRHFSERFSLGFGAAYTTQFGNNEVLPILAFDWNNGKNLMAKAILPASMEFWYRLNTTVDLGLLLSGDGNNFRGDPVVYQVANPQLQYTMLTIGPAAKIRLNNYVCLNIEAGIIGLHRFEFFDGDSEASSYDLKPSQYVRIGFKLG